MLTKVIVSEEHVKRGTIGHDDTASNAPALALQAICKEGVLVWVTPSHVIFDDGTNPQIELPLPTAVEDYFIDDLCSSNHPDAFEFELDIDPKYLK